MKIKYDLNSKYTKYYNEANGMYIKKKKLLKNPNKKARGYIQQMILQSFILIIAFIALELVLEQLDLKFISDYLSNLLTYIVILYYIMVVFFLLTISNYKIGSKKGILEINKEGIVDKSESGIEIKFPYKEIDLIVITNNIIVFFSQTPLMIFVNNDKIDEDKLISEIKKYSDVPIIVKTSRKAIDK